MLARMWAEILKVDRVGIHDNFFDLGGHSLLAVRVINEVEKAFGRTHRISALFQAPTVGQFAKLLSQEVTAEAWSSLVPLQPQGSKLPFFWVHGESSDAFLPRYLGPDQPLYGLMHQGLDGRPARYTSVEGMAAHYLSEIRTIQPHGPYLLGGYCFGGLVAFEMAHQLRKIDERVALLMIVEPIDLRECKACIAGNIPASESISGSLESAKTRTFSDAVARHFRNLETLTTREKVVYVLERIKGKILAGASTVIRNAASWLYLRLGSPLPHSLRSQYILRIYNRAVDRYLLPVYPGRLIIFNCAENTNAPLHWERFATGGLELHTIPGDHAGVLREPNVRVWGAKLKTCVDAAQSARNGEN
jgi:thioesterase domain-containing protein/acyl carrier protein